MKYEEQAVLPRDEIYTRIRQLVDELEKGSYSFAGQTVEIPETAELELKLKVKKGKRKFEIEIEWYDAEAQA